MVKKLILLSIITITLSNCEISTQKVNAARNTYEHKNFSDLNPNISYETINGMEYMFIHHHNGGWTDINLTKDSLECEYYRSQIKK